MWMRWLWLGCIGECGPLPSKLGCNTTLRPSAVGWYCTPISQLIGPHSPMHPPQSQRILSIPHVSWNMWNCSIPHVWRNCHIFELISPVLLQLLSVLDLEFYAITFWQKKSYLPEPEVAILIFCQTCGIDQYHMFCKTCGIEQYHMFGEISHVLQENTQWLGWIFVHITGMLIQWL